MLGFIIALILIALGIASIFTTPIENVELWIIIGILLMIWDEIRSR